MKTGVVTLAFGEPERPVRDEVVPYLERIFMANAPLERLDGEEAARRRSRELAERRAPGLLEEYRQIGGSPMNRQANAHAVALEEELEARGHDATVYVAMQFTEPFVDEVVRRARSDGAERLVALPVYPLCGPSTTVAALEELAGAVDDAGWDVELHELAGWHRHPVYLEIRADAVRRAARDAALDLTDPETAFLFSAHGTPIRYLEEGNRYVTYVEDCCRSVARRAGVEDWALGYQNHESREGVEWTRPDVEDALRGLEARRVLVDPISFMHEQSETLSELDLELREEAEEEGIELHRVPVPHDDDRFPGVLADLVESALGRDPERTPAAGPCRCRPAPATRCLNAGLEADAGS